MNKVSKIVQYVISAVFVISVALYIFHITKFNAVFVYIFLVYGLFLIAFELTSKVNRKGWIRIVLLVIPVLIILLAIQSILNGNYPLTAFGVSLGMYYMLSERHMLSPKKS